MKKDLLPAFPDEWVRFCGPWWDHRCEDFFAAKLPFLMRSGEFSRTAPLPANWYRALALTPPESVKVVILGQDPYPNMEDGVMQAHGLSFSVDRSLPPPRSLRNIFQECRADIGAQPGSVDLAPWAKQGVLLLNTALTVRLGEAGSHRGFGWEIVTDTLIRAISAKCQHCVFILWGNDAREKASLIDIERHLVIESAHPSPLSARKGFFGSKPFSRANEYLALHGRAPVRWDFPDDQSLF